MQVKVEHTGHFSGETENYAQEVADDATLSQIWDQIANGGEKTTELEDNLCNNFEAEEGSITFDDNTEHSAGSTITITWPARN